MASQPWRRGHLRRILASTIRETVTPRLYVSDVVHPSRPWRAVDPDLFHFTVTDLRQLHVALMAAFEESAVLSPALNLEQVRSALAATGWDQTVSDEVLQRSLTALVGWRLLEATQDHAAHYATPEEFERKNLQWSLSPRG